MEMLGKTGSEDFQVIQKLIFYCLYSRIRNAGLRGLQGVVRKTVSDDLQVNIWEPVHMDKIVPSLLYNMHNPR